VLAQRRKTEIAQGLIIELQSKFAYALHISINTYEYLIDDWLALRAARDRQSGQQICITRETPWTHSLVLGYRGNHDFPDLKKHTK
jgi:hypothetical protein